jgi:prepilin-type processing-associated H-X9-DG protein
MNLVAPRNWEESDRHFRARYSVGRTVLYVRKTSELVDPGPASRAVFMDWGSARYLAPCSLGVSWESGRGENTLYDCQPIHHSNGTCLSFADGHVEYWRWSEPDAIALAHYNVDKWIRGLDPVRPPLPKPDGQDYVRLFRAVWGKWPARLDGSVK